MIRKYTTRYQRWQQTVPLVSPFVVVCGVIAVIYFFYRIVLVVSPAVLIERAAFSARADGGAAVCKNDESTHPGDPQPLLSSSYQKRIHEQKKLGPNMVVNPSLEKTDAKTSQPAGYTRTVENDATKYEVLKDGGNRFLRVVSEKPPGGNKPSPAWQIKPVAIKKDKTYAYSFWYRSGADIEISLEYTENNKPRYSQVTTLEASRSWRQFTAHFSSGEATSFRVNLSMKGAGWLDAREFDIHEVPDARLKAGQVSVTFDDGWQSVGDKALRLLEKYDIRSTQYIISDAATQRVPGYMDFAALEKFKKSGHEIGPHTLGHCDQTTLSQEGLERNATTSKQALEQQNLGPVTSFAYPEGRYDRRTQATYEKHYPLIRTSDFGYNDRYFDEANIRSIGVNSDTSDEEFEKWLEHAKSRRLWVVFVYHQVDATGKYSVTSAQLERQLRMIEKSGLKTLPLSEAAKTIRK